MNQHQTLAHRNKGQIGRHGRTILHLNILFQSMAEQSVFFFGITAIPILLGSLSSQATGGHLAIAVIENFVWSATAIIGSVLTENALCSRLNKLGLLSREVIS